MIKYSKELEEFCKERRIFEISIDGVKVYSADTDKEEEGDNENE